MLPDDGCEEIHDSIDSDSDYNAESPKSRRRPKHVRMDNEKQG